MNSFIYDILDNISEGIVILNKKFEIENWNAYMQHLTGLSHQNVINTSIFHTIPSINKDYFRRSLDDVLSNGYKMFFSASMHKCLINENQHLNLKISKIHICNDVFLLLEFIDVTNQFARIEQLKDTVSNLHQLNEKLKEKEKTIKTLAYYDGLTGLPNRTLFYELSEKLIESSKRNNCLLGLMFVDIDKFKNINDSYGHKIGDDVLIEVGKILSNSIRKSDIVARVGGDEFLILLPNLKDENDYKAIVSRIIKETEKPFVCEENGITISLSIGISIFPKDGEDIDKLKINADKYMYFAKNSGGNRYHYGSWFNLDNLILYYNKA